MLKQGLYIAERTERIFDAYTIKMRVKETAETYVFELVEFNSRYDGAHIQMLFANKKKVVLKKNKGGHAVRAWGDCDFTFYPYQAGVPYYFKLTEQEE